MQGIKKFLDSFPEGRPRIGAGTVAAGIILMLLLFFPVRVLVILSALTLIGLGCSALR